MKLKRNLKFLVFMPSRDPYGQKGPTLSGMLKNNEKSAYKIETDQLYNEKKSTIKPETKINSLNLNQSFNFTTQITLEKMFIMKQVLIKKKSILEVNGTVILVILGSEPKNLVIDIKSNDKISYTNACSVIMKWKIDLKHFQLNKNDFEILKVKQDELVDFLSRLKNGDDCFLLFNNKISGLSLFTIEPNCLNSVYDKIEKYYKRFLDDKVNQIIIHLKINS